MKVRVLNIETISRKLKVVKIGENVGLSLEGVKKETIERDREIIFSK